MRAIEVKIRPDAKLLSSALAAIRSYAEHFFKNKKDIDRIILATEEAINNVLLFSVTSHLDAITVTADGCDGEFTVCVLDKGLPGDYEKTLTGDDRLGLTLMHNAVDVVSVENLGTKGRCQKLIKYCSHMPDFAQQKVEAAAPIENADISVRSPKKDEMLQICRLLYGEYGMTYAHDVVYYPDRFYAAVAKDQIHSTVAVDENGNIAGHHAVFQWDNLPGVWEGGMAVVNSNYRNAGVFKKMMGRSFQYVEDIKARLFIGCAVTTHPYTQKLRMKYGAVPCGLYLNAAPPDVACSTFRGENSYTSEAFACSVYDHTPKTVYLPEELHSVAQKIYDWLKLPRTLIGNPLSPEAEETKSSWSFDSRLRNGSITFAQVGKDCAKRFSSDLYELKSRGAEMVIAYIAADAPGLTEVYEAAKAEGFFFTGIFPVTDLGDMLIMQKMVNCVVDYDKVVTTGPFTDLLDIVRSFDPDQKK